MTKKELENIKKNKRWPVTFEDFYSRYFFILFPIGILFISCTAASSGIKNNVTDLFITAIIIGIIGLFLTVFIAVRLYQNQVFVNFIVQDVTKEQIDFALKRTGLNNVKYHKLGYYTATTNVSWFSWGELITIICNGNELLINSRPTGGPFTFQPITIFKDKENINAIMNELKMN